MLQGRIKHQFGFNRMDLENLGFFIFILFFSKLHMHHGDFEPTTSPYTLILKGKEVQFEVELLGLEK